MIVFFGLSLIYLLGWKPLRWLTDTGQRAMRGLVTEGFASVAEAARGMCLRADKSYLGHPLHIELIGGAIVLPAG